MLPKRHLKRNRAGIIKVPKAIELKKSMVLSLTFVIISLALISWTVVVAAENGFFAGKSTSWASDNPSLAGVVKSDGYYDISFTFSSVNYTRQLQNIMINPNSNDAVAGLKGNINGTAVNEENPVFSSLINKGDSLQVDLLVPYCRLPFWNYHQCASIWRLLWKWWNNLNSLTDVCDNLNRN